MMHQEFTGIIKLITNESIIGKVLVCEEENGFVIEHPFVVTETQLQTPGGDMVKLDLRPWAKFSKEELFFIDKEKTITVYESDDRLLKIYNRTLKKYLTYVEDPSKCPDTDINRLDLTEEMGFRSNVHDARNCLEKIYKAS
tara:strand:+ start:442 stop:864 length:423 start_codon:yes stop_codon:yes gene_type:complete